MLPSVGKILYEIDESQKVDANVFHVKVEDHFVVVKNGKVDRGNVFRDCKARVVAVPLALDDFTA